MSNVTNIGTQWKLDVFGVVTFHIFVKNVLKYPLNRLKIYAPATKTMRHCMEDDKEEDSLQLVKFYLT